MSFWKIILLRNVWSQPIFSNDINFAKIKISSSNFKHKTQVLKFIKNQTHVIAVWNLLLHADILASLTCKNFVEKRTWAQFNLEPDLYSGWKNRSQSFHFLFIWDFGNFSVIHNARCSLRLKLIKNQTINIFYVIGSIRINTVFIIGLWQYCTFQFIAFID